MEVLVIGDAVLDVTVARSGPIVPGADAPGTISIGPGGQAANVAVRLARRGLSVALLAPLAHDEAGRLLSSHLRSEGIVLRPLSAMRTGVVVLMLGPDGERTMVSDRAPLPDGAGGEAARALPGAGWTHCSGYALRDPHGPSLAAALGARAAGKLSIGGGSVTRADAAGYASCLELARPELLVVSRDEATALVAGSDLAGLAGALARRFACIAVVTGGANGAAAARSSAGITVPAVPADGPVVDTTGAGDAFAAALLTVLRGSWPPSDALLRRALEEAARAGSRAARGHGAQAAIADEQPPGAAAGRASNG